MNRNEITPAMLESLTPAVLAAMSPEDLEIHILATYQPLVAPAVALRVRYTDVVRRAAMQYRHGAEMATIDPRYTEYVAVSLDVLKSVECAWFDMWPVDVNFDLSVVVGINRNGYSWLPTPTPTPAMIAKCVPAVISAMLSAPVIPTPTMYATLVAGVANRYAPEVLATTSYATVEDWVAGEKITNHPGTTWVVRTVGTSVDVGTVVVYVDDRGSVLTVRASMVDVAEMVRYYAGGMVDDLGATLDTCHTAYDVVVAVCNHLVTTGCNPFDIDGEMVGLVMHTGDYDSCLTNGDLDAYANMWYTSLPADDDAIGDYYTVEIRNPVYIETTPTGFNTNTDDDDATDCCRGCGFPITPDNSWEHDDNWYCAVCHMDMVARGE